MKKLDQPKPRYVLNAAVTPSIYSELMRVKAVADDSISGIIRMLWDALSDPEELARLKRYKAAADELTEKKALAMIRETSAHYSATPASIASRSKITVTLSDTIHDSLRLIESSCGISQSKFIRMAWRGLDDPMHWQTALEYHAKTMRLQAASGSGKGQK